MTRKNEAKCILDRNIEILNNKTQTHIHNQQIALQFNDHGSEVPTKKYR